MSKEMLRKAAKCIRAIFGIKTAYVDVAEILERMIGQNFIEICESNDLRLENKYAVTYPDKNLILIDEGTYDAAVDGEGRARFTIAHEIGHFFLHKNQMALARTTVGSHKIYEDAEWQADTFASYFLIDDSYINELNDLCPQNISEQFGTSYQAAKVYISKNSKRKKS